MMLPPPYFTEGMMYSCLTMVIVAKHFSFTFIRTCLQKLRSLSMTAFYPAFRVQTSSSLSVISAHVGLGFGSEWLITLFTSFSFCSGIDSHILHHVNPTGGTPQFSS
ncbi:hypothetical protein ATANTOWER_024561 [Ataeniobius toweri]|uniref:Uncharacterized protein n=1 Tax=Ataeniobius toweri TaxID=208326 RepID=A0ABU7BV84_9TELE|nr:hypothetical protein [Ataeniobius toweri]